MQKRINENNKDQQIRADDLEGDYNALQAKRQEERQERIESSSFIMGLVLAM